MSDSTEHPDEAGTDRQDAVVREGSTDSSPVAREGALDDPAEVEGAGKRSALSYLEWAGLGLCVVLVLVAGLRVYWGVGAFISLWVASKYEPIVSAGFNLGVLLLAAYGIAILSRRLTATS